MKKIIILFLLTCFHSIAIAQTPQDKAAQDLAKKLSNPVASLISVPFQFNFDYNINPNTGGENGYKMLLNFQPVVPVSLGKSLNLINRAIFPIITQKDVTGKNKKEEGLGDILYTAFISTAKSKLVWGIGPAVSIPSATNEFLGSKKLGIGPSLVVLGQPGKWTLGFLINNIWSVAGDSARPDINSGYAQPFISYGFDGAFTLGVASENSYDWENKRLTSGMVSITMSQVFKIGGKQIASIAMQPKYFYASSRVVKPEWGVRVALTFVFPK